jgi:hypothetical protein
MIRSISTTHPSGELPILQENYPSFRRTTHPSGELPILQDNYPSFRRTTHPSGAHEGWVVILKDGLFYRRMGSSTEGWLVILKDG